MKSLTMILAACAMATAACGSSAMPEPNDPSTQIAAADAPLVAAPQTEGLYAAKTDHQDLTLATKTASQ